MSPEERANALASLSEFRPSLLRIAHYLSRNGSQAEDLVQTTLLKALQHFDSWQGHGPLKNWLIRILTNESRRAGRSRETALEVGSSSWEHLAAEAGWTAEATLKSSERIAHVQQAILRLAAEDREVLLLRDVEGLGGEDTATILGSTVGAMKSRLHRARLRLLAQVREVSVMSVRPVAHGDENVANTNMTCLEVLQCLGDYTDGGLTPPARIAIEIHVAHCEHCRHFSRRYTELLDQLPHIQADAAE